MKKNTWRRRLWLNSLPLFFLLISCHRALMPSAELKPQTALKISASIPEDIIAESTISPYRKQVESKMKEVIGTATVELEGRTAAIETPLGNFVADLQRDQAAKLIGKPVDVGVITRGGLRYSLPKGNITLGDVFELMPFENELMVLTIPGSTMQKLFQFNAVRKIVSTSNATYTIQNGQATNILIGGQPFDVTKTYTMAISDYLANGGDDMAFLKEAIKTEKAGILLRDAIVQTIKAQTAQNKPIEAKVEGRIKVL